MLKSSLGNIWGPKGTLSQCYEFKGCSGCRYGGRETYGQALFAGRWCPGWKVLGDEWREVMVVPWCQECS